MKKLFGIVVLSFMLSTSAKADLYELKIDLNTSEKITQDVRVRNGYSSKCRAELNESGSKMFLDINFYGFKNKINSEIILEINKSVIACLFFIPAKIELINLLIMIAIFFFI